MPGGSRKKGEARKNMPQKGGRHSAAKHRHNTTRCWVRVAAFISMYYNGRTVSCTDLARYIQETITPHVTGRQLERVRRYTIWQDETYWALTHPLWPFPQKLPNFFGSQSDEFRAKVPVNKYGWRKGIKTKPDYKMWEWAENILRKMLAHDGVDWEDRHDWLGPPRDKTKKFDPIFQITQNDEDKIAADKIRRLAYRNEASIRAANPNMEAIQSSGGPRTFEERQEVELFEQRVSSSVRPLLDAADFLDGDKDAMGNTPDQVERLVARKGQRWYDEKLAKAEASLHRMVPEYLSQADQEA